MIDPTTVRLGRLPARHDLRTLHLSDYLDVSKLPKAPASYDASSKVAVWPMMLNDRLGDCTCAAAGHQVQAWTAAAGHETDLADTDILAAYEAVSGYSPTTGANDNGAVELDVLNYWRKTGIAGHTIAAFAKVAPTNHLLVDAAIWLFGGIYIGVALPAAAQKMTDVWDRPPRARGATWQPGSWGGHAVIALSYDQKAGRRKIVTWGRIVEVTDAFWDVYVDEVWAAISPDFLTAGTSPQGFNLAALTTDLAAVGQARTDPTPKENPVPNLTRQWAIATAEQAVVVFLLAFLAPLALSGAGAFNLTAVHAAIAAAGAAVLSFLQSALAGLVKPPSTNVVTALRARRAG